MCCCMHLEGNQKLWSSVMTISASGDLKVYKENLSGSKGEVDKSGTANVQ